MAELRFELIDINKNTIKVNDILSYELKSDLFAPCDGLRLNFLSESKPAEILSVKVYYGDEIIFYGFCDTFRTEETGGSFKIFIYARSLACLLVDNEAEPYVYDRPTVKSLFMINAEEYGFKFDMEDAACSGKYTVKKGTSRYGAINTLVSSLTGKNIIVSPDARLYIPKDDSEFSINEDRIISKKRIINRGALISQIDYKASADASYLRHMKSISAEKLGIKRSKKVNLSSVYDWQRHLELKNMLDSAAAEYDCLQIALEGVCDAKLYAKADGAEGYRLCSVCRRLDKNGERTYLKLFKKFDLKEILYVD